MREEWVHIVPQEYRGARHVNMKEVMVRESVLEQEVFLVVEKSRMNEHFK